MYIPPLHAETNLAVIHALIRAHPLGGWVTMGDGTLVANHIPFLLDEHRGEYGTLVAHIARANPVWRAFSPAIPSVVIFQGPESYITPSWYASKQEHGKVVPTWNYAVVHAHGIPTVIDDRDWLLAQITALTERHEASRALPWQVADAPAGFVENLMKAIIGIEIPIARLEAKWKVSQNRPEADKHGVVAGLRAAEDSAALAMAELVDRYIQRANAEHA